MAISMLKIRRPLGRLIFNMGIAIPGKTVFLIETAPRLIQSCLVNTRLSDLIQGYLVEYKVTWLDIRLPCLIQDYLVWYKVNVIWFDTRLLVYDLNRTPNCYGKTWRFLCPFFRNLHLRENLARDRFTSTVSTVTNSVQNIFTHLSYCHK